MLHGGRSDQNAQAPLMARTHGFLDFIGAARPSIADPFLPRKVEEGRIDDIRECIGCNICISGDNTITPMRCTQNPTMGEEWRKGWHPERMPPRKTAQKILVVGGGPAGLECAMSLARRQYEVTLAEASGELGGRVTRESRLPGLAEWARVRDYRVSQLRRANNVEIFLQNALTAEEILGLELPHVVVATGARWRRDGAGWRIVAVAPYLGETLRGSEMALGADMMRDLRRAAVATRSAFRGGAASPLFDARPPIRAVIDRVAAAHRSFFVTLGGMPPVADRLVVAEQLLIRASVPSPVLAGYLASMPSEARAMLAPQRRFVDASGESIAWTSPGAPDSLLILQYPNDPAAIAPRTILAVDLIVREEGAEP